MPGPVTTEPTARVVAPSFRVPCAGRLRMRKRRAPGEPKVCEARVTVEAWPKATVPAFTAVAR